MKTDKQTNKEATYHFELNYRQWAAGHRRQSTVLPPSLTRWDPRQFLCFGFVFSELSLAVIHHRQVPTEDWRPHSPHGVCAWLESDGVARSLARSLFLSRSLSRSLPLSLSLALSFSFALSLSLARSPEPVPRVSEKVPCLVWHNNLLSLQRIKEQIRNKTILLHAFYYCNN